MTGCDGRGLLMVNVVVLRCGYVESCHVARVILRHDSGFDTVSAALMDIAIAGLEAFHGIRGDDPDHEQYWDAFIQFAVGDNDSAGYVGRALEEHGWTWYDDLLPGEYDRRVEVPEMAEALLASLALGLDPEANPCFVGFCERLEGIKNPAGHEVM